MSRPSLRLSPIRNEIFQFIVHYKETHDGNSPSTRQIKEAVGASSTSVTNYHMGQLEKMGKIEIKRKESRMIHVIGGRWIAPKTAKGVTS